METKSKNIFNKIILLSIAIGIWVNVFQNAGIIPSTTNVKVVNKVDAIVRGNVAIDNTVDIRGSVEVDNTVDINISEINGWDTQSYGNGLLGVYDPFNE